MLPAQQIYRMNVFGQENVCGETEKETREEEKKESVCGRGGRERENESFILSSSAIATVHWIRVHNTHLCKYVHISAPLIP